MVGGKDGTSRHARQTEEFAGAISMAQHTRRSNSGSFIRSQSMGDTPELRLGVRCVSLQLFEHNEKAYRAAVQMMEECGKAAIVHPTGTGKSYIAFKLIEEHGLDKVFAHHITNRSGKYIVFCANKEHMDEMISHVPEWFAGVNPDVAVYEAYSDDPGTDKAS